MSAVVMFPGQGLSPATVDRDEIARQRPKLLETCERLLGHDPFVLEEWPTSVAQPVIYCATLARWSALPERRADCLVGHSLGELTAFVAAGGLAAEEGLRLVVKRGRLTERVGRTGWNGMLALSCDVGVGQAIADASGLALANDNAPRQVVLAGGERATARAVEIARARGVPARRLPVSAAFHSPWMAAAVPAFARALRRCDFAEPRVPVVSAITCRPLSDPVAELSSALVARVRWRELVLTLAHQGADRFDDLGPGTMLSKLVRRTLAEAGDRRPRLGEAAAA